MLAYLFCAKKNRYKKLQIKSLKNLKLKRYEILLFLGGKEMLKFYSTKNLNKADKIRAKQSKNLPKSFKISRAMLCFLNQKLKHKKHLNTSLSHSQNFAIFALSKMNFGVDLEVVKKRDFTPHLEFCFSKKEINFIKNSKNPLHTFYRIWTLKEAQIKQLNLNFSSLNLVGFSQLKRLKFSTKELRFMQEMLIFSISYKL